MNVNQCYVLYLNGHGDAREERVVPVEFRKKLADHLTDRYGLSTASFRVDFLFPTKRDE